MRSDRHLSGTGEHGVGLGKKEYLYEELGEGTVELMKTIKKTLDPLGIMNPGKVSYEGLNQSARQILRQAPQLYPERPVPDPTVKPTHEIVKSP
jgi:hypothetical protein